MEGAEKQAKKMGEMGDRLMKMESRVELIEKQAAVCQRQSGCNSYILGEHTSEKLEFGLRKIILDFPQKK